MKLLVCRYVNQCPCLVNIRRGQSLIWYIDLLVSMYACRCLCLACIGRGSQAGRSLIWYINLLVSRHLSRCYCVVCIGSPAAQSFVSVIGPLKVHHPVLHSLNEFEMCLLLSYTIIKSNKLILYHCYI